MMMKYTFLAIALLGAILLVQGEETEPCADLTLECLQSHFSPSQGVVDSGLSAELFASNKDSGTAYSVTIEYAAFNTTLKRPEMKVSGLSKAQFKKFKIDNTLKKAVLTMYFPSVTVSGPNQTYCFHETGELDVLVDKNSKYSTVLEEVYTNTIFRMNGGFLDLSTAETNTQIMKIPKFSTAASLTEAAAKYPWVKEQIELSYKLPEVITREYIKAVGEQIYKLYMASHGFF